MAVNDFNLIATSYDRLAGVVFGKSILAIQSVHLNEIKRNDSVLILGGGSGKLLKNIPICKEIYFLEKSEAMIRLAMKRKSRNEINFVHADFLSFKSERKYDIIMCPFFLDCFNGENLSKAIEKCNKSLSPDGKLIVADFEEGRSNRILIKMMHLFFGIFANLESRKLQPIHNLIVSSRFRLTDEKFLHRNQLFSRLYRNL